MEKRCMLLIFPFLIMSGAVQAAAPSYDAYGSWLVACDNALTCEAKGFLLGDDVTSIMSDKEPETAPVNGAVDLRFIRGAGPNGVIEARLIFLWSERPAYGRHAAIAGPFRMDTQHTGWCHYPF